MPDLPDLSEYSNASLRELLEDPDRYTPEAVHAAAKELATRRAVPRYYTLARTRVGEGPVRVTRRLAMDPVLKIRMLFSESRLRKYSIALALVYTLLLLFSLKSVADLLHKVVSLKLVPIESLIATGLSLLLQLLMCLFFWALASNLVSRKVDQG